MSEIVPFRGWRYNAELSARIDELVSPLFDVVSERQRAALYRQPLNSLHLSVPRGDTPAAAAEGATRRLAEWQAQGVLRQDELPGLYVYYQYFRLPGEAREFCRKGFIAHIRATPWAEGAVLRHENTLPGAVSDRTELLAALRLQSSATHGLYRDDDFELEALMDEAMRDPLLETEEDYQGARDVLAVVQDVAAIRRFQAVLARQPVILADGHHRYEASVAYRAARLQATGADPAGHEPWQFHLMYLTNAASDDLRILPTHRLVRELPGGLRPDELPARLAEFFTVLPQAEVQDLPELLAGKHGAFGLYLPGGATYKLRLRPEFLAAGVPWPMPEAVRELDLTLLHYYVFERVLGVRGPRQRSWPGLAYVRGLAECVRQVDQGAAQVAFFTNEVTMREVEAVCYSGAVMPPKSTFFYPKVLGGLVFSSVADDDTSLFDSTFWPKSTTAL